MKQMYIANVTSYWTNANKKQKPRKSKFQY